VKFEGGRVLESISVLWAKLEVIISETSENPLNDCTAIGTMLNASTKSLSLLEVKGGWWRV